MPDRFEADKTHLDDLTRRFVEQAPHRAQESDSTQEPNPPRKPSTDAKLLLAILAFGLVVIGGLVVFLWLR